MLQPLDQRLGRPHPLAQPPTDRFDSGVTDGIVRVDREHGQGSVHFFAARRTHVGHHDLEGVGCLQFRGALQKEGQEGGVAWVLLLLPRLVEVLVFGVLELLVEAADDEGCGQRRRLPLLVSGHGQQPIARLRTAEPGGRLEQVIDERAALRIVLDPVQKRIRGARIAQLCERLDQPALRVLFLRLAKQLHQRVKGGRVLLAGQREGGGRRCLAMARLQRLAQQVAGGGRLVVFGREPIDGLLAQGFMRRPQHRPATGTMPRRAASSLAASVARSSVRVRRAVSRTACPSAEVPPPAIFSSPRTPTSMCPVPRAAAPSVSASIPSAASWSNACKRTAWLGSPSACTSTGRAAARAPAGRGCFLQSAQRRLADADHLGLIAVSGQGRAALLAHQADIRTERQLLQLLRRVLRSGRLPFLRRFPQAPISSAKRAACSAQACSQAAGSFSDRCRSRCAVRACPAGAPWPSSSASVSTVSALIFHAGSSPRSFTSCTT